MTRVQLLEGNRYVVYLMASDVRRLGRGNEKEAVKAYLIEHDLVPAGCSSGEISILAVSYVEGGRAASKFECGYK